MDSALFAALAWYLLAVTGISFILMGFDKLTSEHDYTRIPEMWFVICVLLGGFVGVVLGMKVFNHKTRKTSFQEKIAVATACFLIMVLILTRLLNLS